MTATGFTPGDPLDGWELDTFFDTKSYSRRRPENTFFVYHRTYPAPEIVEQRTGKKTPENCRTVGVVSYTSDPLKPQVAPDAPKPAYGYRPQAQILAHANLESVEPPQEASSGSATPFKSFAAFASISAACSGRRVFLVGFDTEFVEIDGRREILSWQFTVADGTDQSVLHDFCIFPAVSGVRLTVFNVLWYVIGRARLYDHPMVYEAVTRNGLKVPNRYISPDEYDDLSSKSKIKICLLSHFGQADLTSFRVDFAEIDPLELVVNAGGGLIDARTSRRSRWSDNLRYLQTISLNIRDTIAQTPAGRKSLRDIGGLIGIPKLDIDGDKSDMKSFLRENPVEFLEYGMRDSLIVLMFMRFLWGVDTLPPSTLSAAGANAARATMKVYLDTPETADFVRVFSGLCKVGTGRCKPVELSETPIFIEQRELEPINGAALEMNLMFARAYAGGWNGCSAVGYFDGATYDYDLQNAYPTAMALVEDLDWESVILRDINNQELTLDDIDSPLVPFVGQVSFSFPESVRFPCLPIPADNTLLYPQTSEGSWEGRIYVCAPEVWLALKLGARVFCERGHIGKTLAGPEKDGRSRALRHGISSLIADRNLSKKQWGKGSVQELILKTMANSVYGKLAQAVAGKRAWNARRQTMDDMGGSSITSPYHAAMTTGLVRAVLLAAANQITDAGHLFASVTTDGFITDAPADFVTSMDLYGLREIFAEARTALSGSPELWEVKHQQTQLLNLTTRGNVATPAGVGDMPGVLARNGIKAPDDLKGKREAQQLWVLGLGGYTNKSIPRHFQRLPELSRVVFAW